MSLYENILRKEEKISLIGLGYVGMPIAVSFARKVNVLGFDISKEKIEFYKSGIDPTKEIGNHIIKNTTVDYTYDEKRLK
jgi:UDP-N-acetyl-D-galactosamine dehydrogenase